MPQFNVTFTAAAIEQMNEAASYLDVQRSGLGFELTLEVALLAERLEANPHMYQLVRGNFRKAKLGKFNYLAFYRISGQDVEIIIIEHGSKKPWYE